MGVNSTDISYDQSESILCGIKSEHAWGVLLHGMRGIGISGNNGRGRVSRKYREASERRKRAILLQYPPPRVSVLADLSTSPTLSDRSCASSRRVSAFRGIWVPLVEVLFKVEIVISIL
jgi:hypothetical protein